MAPFFLQRKKGAGSGRVFAFASIANQPHTLENVYVPGSGVGASTIANRRALSRRAAYIRKPATMPSTGLIYSKNNVTDGGFTVGNEVEKDMRNRDYTNEFDPNDYPEFFPDMAPLIEENIVLGDKNEEKLFKSIQASQQFVDNFNKESRERFNMALQTNTLVQNNVKQALSSLTPLLKQAYGESQ